jgi:anti-sigma B factor antagonist
MLTLPLSLVGSRDSSTRSTANQCRVASGVGLRNLDTVALIDGHNSVSFAHRSEGHVNIGIRKAGHATILDLDGALKLGDSEEAFRNKIQELVDGGSTRIAVNLAGVTELDSSGIGALVRAFTTLKRAGGKATYFAPTKRVTMLLKMVRLDTILDLSDDEGTALSRI